MLVSLRSPLRQARPFDRAQGDTPFSLLIHFYPCLTPWQFLYFFPLPQGQGSFRPILFSTLTVMVFCSSRISCIAAPLASVTSSGLEVRIFLRSSFGCGL